jgi:hypothetical protein
MTWCPADDAQICEDCGVLIADGRRPEHTRFHEVVLSLSLDGLKRLKESAESPGEVTPGDYEELRRDAQELWAGVALALGAASDALAGPRDEPIAMLRVDLDRYRLAIARTRSIVARMVELPREPEALPDDEAGRAYLRGWQDMRALVDKALLPDEGQA